MKKHISILSIIFLVLTLSVFYFSTEFLYNKTKEDLQNLTVEKAIATVQNSRALIEQSINDQAAIIIDVYNLAKTENISSVFILDNARNLIATSNTADSLDIDNKSILYDNAILRKADMTQSLNELDPNKETAEPDQTKKKTEELYLLYSTPLNKGYTLFAEISLENSADLAKHWRNWYYFPGAAVIALVITVLMYLLARLFLGIPYNLLKKNFEKTKIKNAQEIELIKAQYEREKAEQQAQAQPQPQAQAIIQEELPQQEVIEEIPQDEQEEEYKSFDERELFFKENEKKAKLIEALEINNNSLSQILKYCLGDFTKDFAVYIVLNSFGNIIFKQDVTGQVLKGSTSDENNIAHLVLLPEILGAIKESIANPNTKIEQVFGQLNLSFYSISIKGTPAGTIISTPTQTYPIF
jgi:hypothetical protein